MPAGPGDRGNPFPAKEPGARIPRITWTIPMVRNKGIQMVYESARRARPMVRCSVGIRSSAAAKRADRRAMLRWTDRDVARPSSWPCTGNGSRPSFGKLVGRTTRSRRLAASRTRPLKDGGLSTGERSPDARNGWWSRRAAGGSYATPSPGSLVARPQPGVRAEVPQKWHQRPGDGT